MVRFGGCFEEGRGMWWFERWVLADGCREADGHLSSSQTLLRFLQYALLVHS